ncbi:MAG: Nre family DNA repair protein [Desulfurococcales archaeon]|nr:Nre family DNA repair protein [Desulfurococcales archaeon]
MPRIPPELCIRCKGYKMLCGLPRCPILDRFRSQIQAANLVRGTSVVGDSPPGVLVGEAGYPRVRVAYMIPPGVHGEEARYHEAPGEWSRRGEPLSRIIELRSRLLAASMRVEVSNPWVLYEREVSLASVSERPVDSEARLAKPPSPRLVFDGVSKPMGPSAPAVRIRVSSNPRVPGALERVLWDDDLAANMIVSLYESGLDVYTIQKALSLGMLGMQRRRRIVPTRWAITAVDDTVSRHLRKVLRGMEEVGSVEVYRGEYIGNRFLIIVKPGPGSIEWIEAWHPSGLWTKSTGKVTYWRLIEDPLGRASASDGGFSAARLPVLEHLRRRGARGDVVIIREILPTYYAPVGNWHIRETVARALEKGPVARDPTPRELRSILGESLEIPVDEVARRSILLGLGRRVARITDYM